MKTNLTKLRKLSLNEIKYGFTVEDKKDINEEDIQKLRKSLNFESALRKARLEKNKYLPLLKRGSDIIFYIISFTLTSIALLSILFQFPLLTYCTCRSVTVQGVNERIRASDD
ncbi:MAG: hypothetical protein PUP91_20340 [Rhizonema sp. PD37]|nr:hypothetical protein [Rhizonema sp. PD37]